MTENEYKHLRNLVFSEKPYDHKEEQAIIKIFEEIQAYRAIGTVEEFREAKEHMQPRDVMRETATIFKCPKCGSTDIFQFCGKCGCKIDWN